ncbi:MAG: PEP-CTERM sorting domain-containing protein [Armatimonadetes bacterium]|nr:PEP-CTERM sorting domain-containing protein [Armatimonadota bacterium]
MKNKLAAALAASFSLIGTAHAVSYSLVNSSVAFTSGAIGSSGLYVQMPSHFLLGVGAKTAQITYRVTATAGFNLTSVILDPNGATKDNSTVTIAAVHPADATANFFATSAPLTALGDSTTSLSGTQSQYDVTMNVNLAGTVGTGLAKVSVMQVFYTEAPVPEPTAIAGLGLGFAALMARRKRS